MKYTTCVNRKRTAWRWNVQSQSYGRASKCAICIIFQLLAILQVSRTISTDKIQHPPNTAYSKPNNQQKFAPRRSILFLRVQKHDAGQGGWIAFSKAMGRTSEESWFESRQRFIPSQNRPNSLWDLPSLLFTGYRVPFPWTHSDKDMKHTAHSHLIAGSNHWNYASAPPTHIHSRREHGYEIRLHRLGDKIPTGSVNCIQFERVSVLLSTR